jgi:hypothetical protein
MSSPSGGSDHDLLEFLGLPLDFGSAVLADDALHALREPPPSSGPIAGATACSASASKPPAAHAPICNHDPEIFSHAYTHTEHGLRPPSVQVKLCADGKGWGVFALANFAVNDVLFLETPMHSCVEPETSNPHCNNCMRSFCPPLPRIPHEELWTTDAHISCSRGGDSCCAIYCNTYCRSSVFLNIALFLFLTFR